MKQYLKQFFRAFKRRLTRTTPAAEITPARSATPTATTYAVRSTPDPTYTPEEIHAGLLRALAEHSPAATGSGFVDRWRNPTPSKAAADPLAGDMYVSGDLNAVLQARRRKHMGDT